MIVVDASVIASVLVYLDDRGRKARAVMGRDPEWAAPDHWKVEVLSAVRGLSLGGKITDEAASRAVDWMSWLAVDTIPVGDLLPRMWQLRANINAYDAGYVALAQSRGLTLVTADARLARAAIAHCRVELVA